ncbi:MAG: ribbon-helix-helix domain-containing protein [Chloroflexota bacterium]|nr:ribbon-helix-helix domain-containing protein [Chloroflexota bacterium]
MGTAVSLPDDLFEQAERLAKQRNIHRGELVAEAVREYVARHDPDAVTEALNRVIDQEGADLDSPLRAAARRTFERVEW